MDLMNSNIVYKGRGKLKPQMRMEDYLYGIIMKKGPITRDKLRVLTGIPRTILYDTIVKLMMDNKLEKYTVFNKSRGRPLVYYKVIS